jgi:hypothetical protein
VQQETPPRNVQLFSLVAVHDCGNLDIRRRCSLLFIIAIAIAIVIYEIVLLFVLYTISDTYVCITSRQRQPYAMAVPFGFSVGDFIAGIKLLKAAYDSLSDVGGAKADYLDLRKTLSALDKALNEASQFTTPQHQAAVGEEVKDCKECVKKFLMGFKKFELLESEPVNMSKLRFAFRKTQWSLCKKEDIRKFREHLDKHVNALQLQLVIFQV